MDNMVYVYQKQTLRGKIVARVFERCYRSLLDCIRVIYK